MNRKWIFQVSMVLGYLNVVNLTLFNIGLDSRSNHFKERKDDVDQPMNITKDPLHVLNRLITKSETKAMKESLNGLILQVSV
jgi:hypothetical protein